MSHFQEEAKTQFSHYNIFTQLTIHCGSFSYQSFCFFPFFPPSSFHTWLCVFKGNSKICIHEMFVIFPIFFYTRFHILISRSKKKLILLRWNGKFYFDFQSSSLHWIILWPWHENKSTLKSLACRNKFFPVVVFISSVDEMEQNLLY